MEVVVELWIIIIVIIRALIIWLCQISLGIIIIINININIIIRLAFHVHSKQPQHPGCTRTRIVSTRCAYVLTFGPSTCHITTRVNSHTFFFFQLKK
jgi:hypothetical protein